MAKKSHLLDVLHLQNLTSGAVEWAPNLTLSGNVGFGSEVRTRHSHPNSQ